MWRLSLDKLDYCSLGAADTVTGSKHLFSFNHFNLLVDCGLFQGEDEKLHSNSKPDSRLLKVNAILLTHAHLDHCGYLPALYKYGLSAPIYCTEETKKIAIEIMLDSAKILEHKRKVRGGEILYDQNEVSKVIPHFKVIQEDQIISLNKEIKCCFKGASHILGACYVELDFKGRKVSLSGDLGHFKDPLIKEPTLPSKADILFLESTYGDRLHSNKSFDEVFEPIFKKLHQELNTLIIPAFSLARSQLMMFYLFYFLKKNGSKVPVYVDSSLTRKMNDLYTDYAHKLKITKSEWIQILNRFRFVEFKSQRDKLLEQDNEEKKIILTSSGMMTGGFVSLYIDRYIESEKSAFIIVGYQADQTIGRALKDGQKEISLDGKRIYKVKAPIFDLSFFSSHADSFDLENWVQKINPQTVFLTHGSSQARQSLREKLERDREVKLLEFDEAISL